MQRLLGPTFLALLCAACGGGTLASSQQSPPDGGGPSGPTSGTAWAVARGNVTAYEVGATAARGAQLGTTTTNATGGFDLQLAGPSKAPILIVVTGGSYDDPATGSSVSLDGVELTALLPSQIRVGGTSLSGVLVSPVSHLSARLAAYYVASSHLSVDDAAKQASDLLESHFGSVTWRSLSPPPDLAGVSGAGVTQINDLVRAGLLLAGLSQEARTLATAHGLTPGGPLNSLTLLLALADDLGADGFFDGAGKGGAPLVVPTGASNGYALDGQTVRATLAQGVQAFLSNSRNTSRIAAADTQSLLSAVAGDKNSRLFRDSSPVNLTPPAIVFLAPAANAAVQRSVVIEATATAASGNTMTAFAFSSPASLSTLTPTTESGGTVFRLKTTLDVSALPDGQLTIGAQAVDNVSNSSTQQVVVRVANHGPTIRVSNPSEGASVSGTVTITASASAQSGLAVTKLVLTNALAGAGTNQQAAADQLQIVWDTTKMPEGPVTLNFHAEDAGGGAADLPVHVLVANYPVGVFHVSVSAGAPVAGATVQVLAIDGASGTVNTTVGASGVLGVGGPTDAHGATDVTLQTKNYVGPVQVVAGGSSASYVDPSDGVTTIHVPAAFQWSSLVGHYDTNAAANQVTLPLTLWTTLADVEAFAYLGGHHRSFPVPHTLSDALNWGDPLFSGHLTSTAWSLRTTAPASLTTSQQSLRDAVYAALVDVGLNQLARDRSTAAHVSPGSVITALSLVDLFRTDLSADGQFDGLGSSGPLQTPGNPAQVLDASWLRWSLARSLDEWFGSANNKTGLASSDLQYAGVFDRISTDASALFVGTGVAYDNTPPSVTSSSSFSNGGHTAAPVGASHLVAGQLTITVDATDPSGVASLAVQINTGGGWTTLSPGAGSTTAHVVTTVDTTKLAGGLVSVQALAADLVGNAGTTTLPAFTVDNIAPTLTVQHPAVSGSAYSSVVPATIATSDSAGLLSVAESALSTSLTQSTTGNWSGSWPIPSGQADGPQHFTFTSCNVLWSCTTVTVPFVVDRTPPTIALVTAPPRYTSTQGVAPTVAVSVSAADPASGVAGVWATNLTRPGTTVAATYDSSAGTWSAQVALQPNADNTIAVYGADHALDGSDQTAGANTGRNSAAPYIVQVQSLDDQGTPMASTPVQPPSYFDERAMTLVQTGSDPTAISSWVYDPSASRNSSGAVKSAVDASGAQAVHKSAQRLSLGTSSPNLTALFGANPSNTPYVLFTVSPTPFSGGGVGAPITGATYSVTLSCAGCSLPAASGTLVPNTTDTSGQSFLLPLSTEFIPALAQLSSQAQLQVFVTGTNAAGTTAPRPATPTATVAFGLDAPPLVAFAELPLGADPWAAANMTLASGTYLQQFASAGSSTPLEGERFKRWVLYNPGSAVALSYSVQADPSDSSHSAPAADDLETWIDEDRTYSLPTSSPRCVCSLDAVYCNSTFETWSWQLSGGSHPNCSSTGPASGTNYGPYTAKHTTAFSQQAYLTTDGTAPGSVASSAPGGVLLPAAANGRVGMLLLYLGRTAATIQPTGYQLDPSGVPQTAWNSTAQEFDSPYAEYTTYNDAYRGPNQVGCDKTIGNRDVPQPVWCWTTIHSWQKKLSAAQTNLSGQLAWSATALGPGATTTVGATATPSPVRFTAPVGH